MKEDITSFTKMPRFSKTLKSTLQCYVKKYIAHIFSTDRTVLLYAFYENTINHKKMYL